MDWAERQMGGGSFEEPAPSQRSPQPIRGFLLQNIYGNGTGAMALAYRSTIANATRISVLGTNYTAGSSFKLQLVGTLAGVSNAQPQVIATSIAIPVNTDAPTLQGILLRATQGANLPVATQDLQVGLGNPLSSAFLVLSADPASQPEIVLPTTNSQPTNNPGPDPQTYIGVWVITITGALAQQYVNLNYQILQDTNAFMRGLSFVVAQETIDLPGTTVQVVTDILNRPPDYPWRAGSLCVAIPFLGLGYGIVASDFREQIVSIPTSSS